MAVPGVRNIKPPRHARRQAAPPVFIGLQDRAHEMPRAPVFYPD